MVLDKFSSNLKNTLSKIKNSITVDRDLVNEIVKDIQKALLSSDVNVRLVLDITSKIKKRAIEEKNEALDKKEHLVTIIYEELSRVLGDGKEFELKPEIQNRILLVGLYGQGKTTTAGKLGLYFKNRGKKVALISTDTWRPAAFEQLKQLGERIEIKTFGEPSLKKPEEIYSKYKKELEEFEVVIIDSAGRDFLNDELVEEISNLNSIVEPTDTFLVIGADVGQTAQKQAEMFKEKLNITGVIITKLDGTAKGGGALSACYTANAPVKFIGVGEDIADLERFNSTRFVSELLGMGDIEKLLEKAKLAIDEEKAKEIGTKFLAGEFDLDDLYEQMKAMNKMGSMSKLLNLIPGVGSLGIDKNALKTQEEKMKKWKYAMDSMTKKERKDPSIINISRIKRIAAGSGTSTTNVRELLKQYKMMKKMTGMFKNPENMMNLEKEMGNMENPQEMMKMMKKFGGAKMLKQMMRNKKL
jgi:signal recognition particle subunit SRP54